MSDRIDRARADRSAPPPPLVAGPPTDPAACRYLLSTRDGKVYAVDLRDGWIPARVVGPFAGPELAAAPHEQDWSAPADASRWNAATLVRLCDAERARLIAGGDVRRRTPARPPTRAAPPAPRPGA